jgi:hypothetical protein
MPQANGSVATNEANKATKICGDTNQKPSNFIVYDSFVRIGHLAKLVERAE